MMLDRRALIIGSWLAKGRDLPSQQKVKAITKTWANIFKKKQYNFKSLKDPQSVPQIVYNPELAELTAIFEQAKKITSQTELLLYFLGHSTASGEDDIRLILGQNSEGEDRTCPLSLLLSNIQESSQIRRLIIILDTCHAGRIQNTLKVTNFQYFAMVASGNAYAFNAQFSEGILKALEEPIKKSDQRIDRLSGGDNISESI